MRDHEDAGRSTGTGREECVPGRRRCWVDELVKTGKDH